VVKTKIHLHTNHYSNTLYCTSLDTLAVMLLEPAEILANPVFTVGSWWAACNVLRQSVLYQLPSPFITLQSVQQRHRKHESHDYRYGKKTHLNHIIYAMATRRESHDCFHGKNGLESYGHNQDIKTRYFTWPLAR